ncbi:MAG: glutaredoxin family protein [Candidatus Lokiarchaeota archaeon]|nr:glutaredoxin family protein [Candidatus Lokiarchaeota archaeon]
MFPEFINDLFQEVEGKNDIHNVAVFALSTCMWCKKAKNFLNERGIKYRYIYVDQIDPSEKSKVLTYLRENYKPERISYPFVVCDDEFVVGYNPGKYEELINQGGN